MWKKTKHCITIALIVTVILMSVFYHCRHSLRVSESHHHVTITVTVANLEYSTSRDCYVHKNRGTGDEQLCCSQKTRPLNGRAIAVAEQNYRIKQNHWMVIGQICFSSMNIIQVLNWIAKPKILTRRCLVQNLLHTPFLFNKCTMQKYTSHFCSLFECASLFGLWVMNKLFKSMFFMGAPQTHFNFSALSLTFDRWEVVVLYNPFMYKL